MEKEQKIDPEVSELKDRVDRINTHNEVSVLLGLVIEKLGVTPSEYLWRDLSKAYHELGTQVREDNEYIDKMMTTRS